MITGNFCLDDFLIVLFEFFGGHFSAVNTDFFSATVDFFTPNLSSAIYSRVIQILDFLILRETA